MPTAISPPSSRSSPVPTDIQPPRPSAATQNLIALSQDIAALLSLSIEATASLVHDVYRRTLGAVGWRPVTGYEPVSSTRSGGGEGGRGLAVVVVGAGEATGQSLSLQLAKSGYTVFPLVPLPSPHSPPTSTALTSLLLAWSRIQKRINFRHPIHPGSVVPIITDPEIADPDWTGPTSELKFKGRYAHAGETVRAYCHENGLCLVAVVCSARKPRQNAPQVDLPTPLPSPPLPRGKVKFIDQIRSQTPPTQLSPSLPSTPAILPPSPPMQLITIPRPLGSGLSMIDESSLMSMYRANIVEPLAIIRELSDLLSTASESGRCRGRVIFVNGDQGLCVSDVEDSPGLGRRTDSAMRMIGAARSEAAKLLRAELGLSEIDVCEVVVGPMSSHSGAQGCHLRHSSDESTESDQSRKKLIEAVLKPGGDTVVGPQAMTTKEAILARRIALLSRIWAVDDALLFSAVRRAIEDRYPRYRHHAGLSPLLASIGEITPGAGIVRMLGRWIVGRLLMPRSG